VLTGLVGEVPGVALVLTVDEMELEARSHWRSGSAVARCSGACSPDNMRMAHAQMR
jgi:hypothetical protein